VEIAGRIILKAYTEHDKVNRLNLQMVYHLLQIKDVPYVDRLVTTFDTTAVLSPRGMNRPPEDEEELLGALVCVLESLKASKQSGS
jgi:hypothetical protein